MSIHSDDFRAQPGDWPADHAQDYARAFGVGGGRPRQTDTMGAVLDQMTGQIQGRIAELERRHAEAMREMQAKLERMTGDAHRARPAVPNELASAFSRIEQGMAHLAGRMADTSTERRRGAENFVFGAPKPERTHFVFNPPAHQPVAPVKIDNGPAEPWDHDAAEALASLYESGEAVLGKHLPEAALFAHDRGSMSSARPTPAASTPKSADAVSAAPSVAPSPMPQTVMAAGLGDDRQWLDERLANLGEQVALSLKDVRPDAALDKLMSRVDQLETRFTSALDGIATKADLKLLKPESLSGLEAQIKELAAHFDHTQQQLSRLDVIEQHLSDLNAFAHASMDAEQRPASAEEPMAAHDLAHLADMAVERALAQMPASVPGSAGDGDRAETQARIDAVHGLLEDFAAERRRGDQYTTGMLETVQEALIRLIDRVDAIDAAQSRAAAAVVQPVSAQPAMQPASQPITPAARAAIAAEIATQASAPAVSEQAAKSGSSIRNRVARKADVVAEPVEEKLEPLQVQPDIDPAQVVQPEISIKDLRIKAKRSAAAAAAAAETAAGASADPVAAAAPDAPAKVQRATRAPAVQASSGAGKRGILIAAMALGLVGVAFVATKMWGDQFGGVVPPSLPKSAPQPAPAPAEGAAKAAGPAAPVPATGASQPPGLVAPPGRLIPQQNKVGPPQAAPEGAGGANSGIRSEGPAPRRLETQSQDLTLKPANPASVPETVSDDLSMTDTDGQGGNEVALASAGEEAIAPSPVRGAMPTVPFQGMAIDSGNPQQRLGELAGMQRQSSMAAASERLGFTARPASDFSGRFGAVTTSPQAKEAPKAAASIVTGSNPTTKPEQVSYGAPFAKAAPAPVEAAGSDSVPETAELPPALIGPLSLRMAAAKGDPSASFEVATRFAEGRGIKQDFKQAMTWYQRASAKGSAIAQYRLGTLYERGLGTPVDTARARLWYKRAADQGNVKAMHNLAVLSAGNGQAAPDYTTAAKFFKDAADRGLADSQFNLGVLHENGLGVAKDVQAAYVWFSLAARAGDGEATRRRDHLMASLDAATLKAADEQVRIWRARQTDPKINDPRVAGDQWRAAANQFDGQPMTSASSAPEAVPAQAAAAVPASANNGPVARTYRAPAPTR